MTMSSTKPFSTVEGFATLGPELVRARALLEERFLAWAAEVPADQFAFPPAVPVDALAAFDYFDNFPHLVLLVAPLDAAHHAEAGPREGAVDRALLADSRYGLTSAACYNVYLHLSGAVLDAPRYVTTVANCFRNETHYDGLRRLRGFTMREIVCVGDADAARALIAAFKPKVLAFAATLGLELDVQVASDPFFQPEGSRAVLQKLFPVKEEFVFGGSLAIASVNFHRNFFGERCGIRLAEGTPASSACVAFGLERWLAALLETHGDAATLLRVVERATG
jgi:seryl-tRNA synthetase